MGLPDLVGLIGVAAFLVAYGLLQFGRLRHDEPVYLALNGFGSLLVLVSLFYSFNLPSFVTQVMWLVFTVIGFVRVRNARA